MDTHLVIIFKLLFMAFLQASATLFFVQNIRKGRVFEFYGNFLSRLNSKNLRKILGECPFCFGILIYSATIFAISFGIEWQWYWHLLAYYACFLLSYAMLNFLIYNSPFNE